MKIIQLIVGLLFPRHCAYCNDVIGFLKTCEKCDAIKPSYYLENQEIDKNTICAPQLQAAYAVFEYKGLIKKAIILMKFDDNGLSAKAFAQDMSTLINTCNDATLFDIIVPVPTHKKRLIWRGYNVPTILAKHLSEELLNKPLCATALVKLYETEQQSKLSSKRRRANLIGVFNVTDNSKIANKNVLLVDDIITTGSTLNECAKALLIAGAKSVTSICIASSTANLDRK